LQKNIFISTKKSEIRFILQISLLLVKLLSISKSKENMLQKYKAIMA